MEENYNFLISLTIDTPDDNTKNNIALVITFGHSHEAHATSPSASTIIDCNASSHFLLSCEIFINYQKINSEPVCAADRCTFSAFGRGDLQICLPMKAGEKLVPILLKEGLLYTYYGLHTGICLMS